MSVSGSDKQVISYCLANVDADSRALLRRCDAEVVEEQCLGRCGVCYCGPFLLVDDTLLSGATHAELINGSIADAKEA